MHSKELDQRSLREKIVIAMAVNIGAFTVLLLFTTTVGYVARSTLDPNAVWTEICIKHLTAWLPWMMAAPFIFILAKHQRPTPEHRIKPLLLHLGVSFLWLPIWIAIFSFLIILQKHASLDGYGEVFLFQFRRGILFDYTWYWAIVVTSFAFYNFKDYLAHRQESANLTAHNARLSEELAKAELQSLRAQLQPHFLFNAHNAIAGLIRADDKNGALKALSNLSQLFRYTLETETRQLVKLREEQAFLNHYLEIQKVRFQDRLKIEMALDAESLEAELPSMLLQPLVENAVHHGVSAFRNHNFVKLKGSVEDGLLKLEILNSVDPEAPDSSGFGIGLKNVRARLKRYYGPEHELEMELLEGDVMSCRLKFPAHPLN